jgi:tetratricopeptide (TPR) repeat protein
VETLEPSKGAGAVERRANLRKVNKQIPIAEAERYDWGRSGSEGKTVRRFWNSGLLSCGLLLCAETAASQQVPVGVQPSGSYLGGLGVDTENLFFSTAVEVDIRGPNGAAILGPIYVSLIKENGQVFMTALAKGSKARFDSVPKSQLTAQVVASGYETARKSFEVLERAEVKLRIELQPMSDKEAAASDRGISALSPKAQKDIGRALEALRANRSADARNYLEAAQRDAPNSAEVAYLFGVYASQLNDMALARSYWTRALELNPSHLSALLAVSQDLLHAHKAEQARPYLDRAVEIEPSSWRVHMLLAQANLFEGKKEDAVQEAERALELGHDRASSVQPLLAHALYESGEKDRAIKILQDYVAAHPADENAPKLLERLTAGASVGKEESADVTVGRLSVAPNWLPPDIDEKIPAVEAGAGCSLEDVVAKAGLQLVTFVHDVDRFAATENLVHESINKYGVASAPEKRKFDYLVSIEDLRPGYLGVTEYRNGGGGQTEFPDGVVTSGLPALVLVFHPYYAPNYEMTCEGLARAGGRLAWQIHFRQIQGKPNALKSYQIGMQGPSYAVALKGRAWISADDYQVIRMETDIVAPIPEIKLFAEHTEIEYGPVKFKQDNVTLWLPQSAEVYFAWRGRQVHRRHSFDNYLLFGVDEKQRIGAPKDTTPEADAGSSEPAKP